MKTRWEGSSHLVFSCCLELSDAWTPICHWTHFYDEMANRPSLA